MPIETQSNKPAGEEKVSLLNREFQLTKPKVKTRDRMFFTEQLALLLETGTSLHNALGVIRAQTQNPAMQEMLDQIATDVSEGKTFSTALARNPEVFSSSYINLVGASESGGFMHEVLEQLMEMEDKREQLRSQILSAFSYPAFLILFSVGVVIFILVGVFPRFEDMFIRIHDQLPTSTVVFLAMSQILRGYWPVLLIGLAGAVIGFRLWLRSANGQEVFDRTMLRMPGLRDIMVRIYLVNSMRALGLSLAHGVSVIDALESCREVVPNQVFRRFFRELEESVEAGGGLARGFQRGEFIPEVARQMIQTGEESGHLPRVMTRIADYYERELSRRLMLLSKLVEPVMLVVMGVVVGYLVSALIFPIFKLAHAS